MSDVSKFKILGKEINIKDKFSREKIDELSDDVYLTECVWLGDSFSVGYQHDAPNLDKPIPEIVSEKLKLNIHKYGVNASGYVTSGDGGSTFYSQAVESVNDLSYDHNKVKYVFILGGLNDYNNENVTKEQLNGASVTLVNYLMYNYRNAIIVAIPNWAAFDMGAKVDKMLSIGSIDLGNNNRRYLFLKKNLLSLQGYSNLINVDNVHPNQRGAIQMGECIYDLLHGVEPNLFRRIIPITNSNWNVDNLGIIETFDEWYINGSVRANVDIVPGNTTILEFPHSVTFYGVPFIVTPSKNGTSSCILQYYPSIDAVGAGSNGYINMFFDLGNQIKANDNVLIDMHIRKNQFL